MGRAAVTCALLLQQLSPVVFAHSEYRSRIPNGEVVSGVRALGHANLKGGGKLNAFGRDFKAAGFTWTKWLCERDSDRDGESNGLELGDPCCVWTAEGGIPPLRSWRISHPGMNIATEGVRKSGIPMPNCSAAEVASEAAARHASLQTRISKDLATVQGASFTAFYYTNSFYAKGHAQTLSMGPGTKIVLSMLLGFVGLAWFERRCCGWKAPVHARGPGRGGGACTRLRALFTTHLIMVCMAIAYVDVLSGLLHIVLDNPSFTTLPLLGPGAVGFQRHHHHPAGITVHNLLNFVQEHLAGISGVLATGLLPARWSAGANTNLLRLFLIEVILLSCFMMASHRWSHTQKEALSPLVVWLQESGALLSHLDHSLHHVDYNCNFAIFTGWCNPCLNRLTAHVLNERSELWLGMLILWGATPALVGRCCFYRPFEDADAEAEARAADVELAKHPLITS